MARGNHVDDALEQAIQRFSWRLRRAMWAAGVDCDALSEATGASIYTVKNWYYGRTMPKVHYLEAIREALGCSWDELMGGR